MGYFARFILFAVGMLFVFCGALVGVRALGERQISLASAVFTNPDGSNCQHPCLFGVQLEASSPTEALSMLQAHPLTRYLQFYEQTRAGIRLGYDFGQGILTVNLVPDTDGHIHYMSLAWNTKIGPQSDTPGTVFEGIPTLFREWRGLSLGQFVALFGVPSRFQTTGSAVSGTAWSYYLADGIAIQTRRQSGDIGMNDELMGIFVSRRWQDTSASNYWPGFVSVERYIAERQGQTSTR